MFQICPSLQVSNIYVTYLFDIETIRFVLSSHKNVKGETKTMSWSAALLVSIQLPLISKATNEGWWVQATDATSSHTSRAVHLAAAKLRQCLCPALQSIFLAIKYFKARNMVHETNQLLNTVRQIPPQKDGTDSRCWFAYLPFVCQPSSAHSSDRATESARAPHKTGLVNFKPSTFSFLLLFHKEADKGLLERSGRTLTEKLCKVTSFQSKSHFQKFA